MQRREQRVGDYELAAAQPRVQNRCGPLGIVGRIKQLARLVERKIDRAVFQEKAAIEFASQPVRPVDGHVRLHRHDGRNACTHERGRQSAVWIACLAGVRRRWVVAACAVTGGEEDQLKL